MAELLKTVPLDNGLTLEFLDRSNRYFGDFYRVCITVRAELPLAKLDLTVAQKKALQGREDGLCYARSLERMGVAGADLARVKDQLIKDFLNSSLRYLEKADFPEQLLRKKLAEKPRPSFQFHP